MQRPLLLALLAVGISMAGCTGEPQEEAPAREAWVTHRDEVNRFQVTYPAHWVRADEVLTPQLADPHEILSLGTYKLRPGSERCATHIPVNALDALGAADAFLTIQERRDAATERSGPRPEQFRLPTDTRGDADICLRDREPLTAWVPFKDQGRAFYALYVVGPDASKRTREELLRILQSIRFDRVE
jgi:hypothetical protein